MNSRVVVKVVYKLSGFHEPHLVGVRVFKPVVLISKNKWYPSVGLILVFCVHLSCPTGWDFDSDDLFPCYTFEQPKAKKKRRLPLEVVNL